MSMYYYISIPDKIRHVFKPQTCNSTILKILKFYLEKKRVEMMIIPPRLYPNQVLRSSFIRTNICIKNTHQTFT